MFIKPISVFLLITICILLSGTSLLVAEDSYFSLSEKWSLQFADLVRAIRLYDLNHNNSQEILIGAGSMQDCYQSCYGFVHIASDSARDIMASSAELPYGISCIEAGDLDLNGIPEILAGMSDGVSGGVSIFSNAQLDSQILVPDDDFFPAVISLKTVPMEDSTIVYVTVGYLVTECELGSFDLGAVCVGKGYLCYLHEFYWTQSVPQQMEFADSDLDGKSELILGGFYRSVGMTWPGEHATSADISIITGLADTVIKYQPAFFSFDSVWYSISVGGFRSLIVGNCDGDSNLEVLGSAFVDTSYPSKDISCITVLSVFDGLAKTEQWKLTYYDTVNIISGIGLVDYNHDGINEVLVAHKNAPMELLNGEDGSKIAESDSSYSVDHFAFGDVDGDGQKEIVIGDGYYLRVFESDFTVDVPEQEDLSLSKLTILGQNYPNPFNSSTTVPFTVRSPMHINLSIYNILGQKIRTLVDDRRFSGDHQIIWDGKDDKGETVPSGIYFYKLTSEEYSESKKMLFLK